MEPCRCPEARSNRDMEQERFLVVVPQPPTASSPRAPALLTSGAVTWGFRLADTPVWGVGGHGHRGDHGVAETH